MSEEFVIADTKYGKVRGQKIISEVEIPYIRFLGIPYAKPPVGNRRFQAAEEPDAWDDVIDALEEPQPSAGKNNYINKFVGSEDCLYLNVYTKCINPKKPMATIVYIHGGGFYSGSSTLHSYSPDYILMHDVVMVIFNYRLGPHGFLKLNDKSLNIPGNAGMKDQQLVLKFVKENIKNFGGDPNNVTLMGHSSGAGCVGLHCMSETSKGFFHRAIALSGSPSFIMYDVKQLDWAKKLAEKLEFKGDLENEREILKFLENYDILKMAEVAPTITTSDAQKKGIFLPFGPCVEDLVNETSFMTKSPIDLMTTAWSKDIDIITGGTIDEGIIFFKNRGVDLSGDIPKELNLDENEPKFQEFIKRLEDFYFTKFESKEKAQVKIKGDSFIWRYIHQFTKARAHSGGKGKTFLYNFAVDSPTQNHYRIRQIGPDAKGVSHADELSYFWKNGQGGVPPKDSMEWEAILRFTSSIAEFVMTGNPNNKKLGDVKWLPVSSEPFEGLIFNEELKFQPLDECERAHKIWEQFYHETGTKYF
ncbi:hypothetical protein PVAND_009319 [Polypedilum vanderplanki]|uniref:Carboxylic ester hydrolase n=1 Tax=Polypedilum vanderplanki TaxID=319348 RepID=A0A9J6CCY0_POLVA|nr:hypothetical protein PVAND_009319 [Polypedilum vanderplanki]